jgi:hypothetical protein
MCLNLPGVTNNVWNILECIGLPLHVKRVKPCDNRESVLSKQGNSNLY